MMGPASDGVPVYDPDNFRRKSRDWSAQEGSNSPPHDSDAGAKLSVSAAAASSAHPVFAERTLRGRDRQGRRPDPGRLTLVPPHAQPEAVDERERLARLFGALADHVIPQLVGYHAESAAARDAMKPTEAELEEFFGLLLQDDEPGMGMAISRMRERGLALESIYLDAFIPCAHRMGDRWRDDCSDFVAVTVAVGRLQHFVRHFSPEFCNEVSPRGQGRRILLAQPDGDTHMFGLSLVAEFFRRDGWDVVGGVSGSGVDPAQRARSEWFDVAGLSIGSELLLPWLKSCIAEVREQSCNRDLLVMVGGPLFSLRPELVMQVGADLTADARSAAGMVGQILALRDPADRANVTQGRTR